jgi:hypothetical protein
MDYVYCFIGLNPQVQTYLEEHLLKSLTPRSQLLNRPAIRKGSTMRRRMSVKGAIKKTRSIAVERKYHICSDAVWKLNSLEIIVRCIPTLQTFRLWNFTRMRI